MSGLLFISSPPSLVVIGNVVISMFLVGRVISKDRVIKWSISFMAGSLTW